MRPRIKSRLLTIILLIGFGGCSPLIRNIPILHQDEVPTVEHKYGVTSAEFRRTFGSLFGPSLVDGNSVTTLVNGDQIFTAMLDSIRQAQKSITFETYIYWSGDTGKQFADALSERARSGVKVHVIVDWFGMDRIDSSFIGNMKEAGVELSVYHPVAWYYPGRWISLKKFNNRTHRKILVLDGRTGYTGGVGIADEWNGDAQSAKHWRDTHFRFVGPVVAQLQSAFVDNWLETGGQVLDGDLYFPAIPAAGSVTAQAFKSSPTEASANIELMYHVALASAEQSIKISSSYFVPDEPTIRVLKEAAKRGVKVEIIVPGENIDQEIVRAASRALWGDLLEAGVKIYEYQPTMFHCKSLVVDDHFVSVGSSNFDDRSFRTNDEANVNIFDDEVALEQSRIFENDRKNSKEITLKEWKKRGLFQKIAETFGLLFRAEI